MKTKCSIEEAVYALHQAHFETAGLYQIWARANGKVDGELGLAFHEFRSHKETFKGLCGTFAISMVAVATIIALQAPSSLITWVLFTVFLSIAAGAMFYGSRPKQVWVYEFVNFSTRFKQGFCIPFVWDEEILSNPDRTSWEIHKNLLDLLRTIRFDLDSRSRVAAGGQFEKLWNLADEVRAAEPEVTYSQALGNSIEEIADIQAATMRLLTIKSENQMLIEKALRAKQAEERVRKTEQDPSQSVA